MSPKGKRAKAGPVPVEEIDHDETRTNIPTEELRDFVADDEGSPPDKLYPRDPSLDPQLVWTGKDEQDREDLSVPTVPIYIQETVRPQAIIENLRETAAEGEEEPELTLFDDLRSLEFKDLVDFYSHADRWTNRLILGDSLLVMNSLAEKERLRGKVQTIYIDPPYGIKFGSNWQVSTRKRDVKDGRATDATRQPEQVKAFRDTWELGIHSYLSYLRDRLVVSRELLTDSGSCFLQIGDENVHRVRSVMDEVFGEDNFVSLITFVTTTGVSESARVPVVSDYLVWYAKSRSSIKVRPTFEPQVATLGQGNARWILQPDGAYRGVSAAEQRGERAVPPDSKLYFPDNLVSQGAASEAQPFSFEGKAYEPPSNSHWKAGYPSGMERLAAAGRIHVARSSIRYRRFADDFPFQRRGNLWSDTGTGNFTDDKVYVVQTNTKVIERCLLMTSDPGDLILDPTCGSGTTAVVAEKNGRRWITIDTSRVSVALARTRIMAARHPAYLLADSPDGQAKEQELSGTLPDGGTRRDIRKGFVYKRVPHITLKSIAQNPDIKEGMSGEEIDAAVARHADQELLYDQPYENKKAVRVAGPFTVESLSPHRILDFDPDRKTETDEPAESSAPFTTTILENLKRAGVQNTVRDEHLDFTSLEPFAGRYIHMRGEYEQKAGGGRSVAVSLGPERGTVGADWVNQAAKEALKGAGCDLLLVCAFAFDGHASEEAREFAPDEAADTFAVGAVEEKLGKLPILLVRMNPDLDMGEDLLKKTGSGNLFMVFGEPDILIEDVNENEVEVEIRGLDVYDPTTGQVRSDSTDDIACWFIDTNYNEESFFVRHAYFTGGDNPYDKLKRALRADIDDEAWASLNRTRSRPFPRPESGRIAVKVINHYGDEILKTYEIAPAA